MKTLIIASVCISLFLFTASAFAHTPYCNCLDNGDGTITCEGGYSDGSPAAGISIIISDADGKELLRGEIDEFGEYTFERPEAPFFVLFDGGEGHRVQIPGAWIK